MAESSYPDLPVMDEKSLGRSWKVIGAGGFGQVYKARHLQWKSDVAVKLIGLDDGSEDKSLLREVELMRQAESAHVIKVLGVFKGRQPSGFGTYIGLVMELMERGSLASLQKKLKGAKPWPLVFQLAYQVAVGMNHLHSLDPPIIHKDLKPDNVLLDKDLNAKITDFGLSKFGNCSTSARTKGAGTTSYMAPEAIDSLDYKATPAFDVYSYGILLCSIMKGKEPYGQDVRTILEMQVCFGKRPSLDEVDPKQATGLEELVELMEMCWHQEPDKRPPFSECTAVTAALLEKHQPGIKDAVHQVVTELFPPPSLQDQEESGEEEEGELIQEQDQRDHALQMKEMKSELESLQREMEEREMEERERLQMLERERLQREMEERERLQREMEERERLQREMEEREREAAERKRAWGAADKLRSVWREFRERVSEPVLDGLLDQLLEKRVFTDEEMERVRAEEGRADKARQVHLMVVGKGNVASLVMMDILRQLEPGLIEELQQAAQRERARGAADKLRSVWGEFKERVSEPVLDGLLDQLLEKRVITDEEMERVRAAEDRAGKAWRVLSMVVRKGDVASSVMMDILRQLDPVLSEELQQAAQRERARGAADKLRSVWREFRERVSEPVLDGLLDQLLEKRVFTDEEMERVRAEEGRADKARQVHLMVVGKGDVASLVMMDILRQLEPGLIEELQQAAAQRERARGAADKLWSVRREFIDSVSEPVLDELLDQLLEKRVITDEEMERVRAAEDRADKARQVLFMVVRKGDEASLVMMDILRQLDPVLSEKLWE